MRQRASSPGRSSCIRAEYLHSQTLNHIASGAADARVVANQANRLLHDGVSRDHGGGTDGSARALRK
jgi:hypothetical protein